MRGTYTRRSTPVQVQGLSSVAAISSGHWHSFAVENDGTVWAWGNNWAGQLGDGTTKDRLTPIQIQTNNLTSSFPIPKLFQTAGTIMSIRYITGTFRLQAKY